MIRNGCRAVILMVAISLGVHGKDEPKDGDHKNKSFEQLKKLTGTWVQTDEAGKPTDKVVSVFKLTGAGSAVHETIFPGSGHEMVTVYHLDGKDLVLTHYCAAGNQPRMKANAKAPANELRFEFAGGSNIDPAKDMHMHEGSIKIIDDDHIEWSWVGWMDGKPAGDHKVSLKLARKK